MNEYERRKRGRDDLVRVQADHERKQGKLPDMRRIEGEVNRRADRIDAHRDRNIKGGYGNNG